MLKKRGFKIIDSQKGFTFVEVLVYVGVIGILVIAISNLTLGMMTNYRTASIKDELALSAREVFEVFFKETKNASKIYLPDSVFDNDLGMLVLETNFQLGDEYGFGQAKLYVSEGRIWIKRHNETPLVLTPDSLEATQFRFERVKPKSDLEGVRFYLTLRNKARTNETFSFTTFAMIRGGYIK